MKSADVKRAAVVAELKKRIIANNFKEITVTMKCNGEKVTISPCSYSDDPTFEDVEYYLVYCSMPWCGSDKIEDIADLLINYEDKLNEQDEEEERLHAYYVKNHNTANMDWDWYSDWHKSVYGYRPRNGEH